MGEDFITSVGVSELRSASAGNLCYWADTAPAALCDAAEGWGMTKLPDVFARAHSRLKSHDDGTGHCKVCGASIDFEKWLDEDMRLEDASE